MKELIISPDFTVDDIHAIREYEYEKTKDMTFGELKEYYREVSEEYKEIFDYWRNKSKIK